jgi:hypothetical protein
MAYIVVIYLQRRNLKFKSIFFEEDKVKKYLDSDKVFWSVFLGVACWFIVFVVFFIGGLSGLNVVVAIWWTLVLAIAVFSTVFFFLEIAKPIVPEETQSERQELENWLVLQGYAQFIGSVIYDKGEKTFENKTEKHVYPLLKEHTGVFGNYQFYDYKNFRTVCSNYLGAENMHYIKIKF